MRDDDSQNEALARFLAENTSDMVVESSAEGRILFASHSCERILGYGTADLRGLETASLIHPQDVDGVIEALSSRIAGGEDGSDLALTYRMRNAGGDWIWVEGRPRIKYGPGGEYLSVLDILRDVTERRQAELALAESEAQLRFLSEQSHDVVIRVEPGKGVVYVSPSCRRYGWEPEELLGQAGFEIMHPEDRPHIVAIIADMYEGRENRDANREQRMRTKAGDWVWMEGAPTIIRDDAGAPVGFVSVLRDISKRKEVKAALAASEARYRLLAENASDIVTECDLSGRFTYVSSSVEAVTGFSVSEVVGRQALDFCHPDDWERVKLEIAASIESPGGQRIEHRHIRKDGRVVWMQTQPRLARDPITGKAMAVTDVMRDVTERRAAEEAMAKSQAAYRLLADHSMDVILRIGPGDVIRYVSPSCRRFGYEPDDLIGRTGFELVHPEDHDHLHKLIEDLFRTGQVDPKANREYRLRANDGRYVWMEGNPSIVRDEAGAAIEVVSVLRDVSQRKCLEAELLAAKDAAEAATVAKGEFLANMSHEIRTPLTSILGFNKLMAEEPDLGERARKYLGRVGVAAQALLATVNDILDFSKLEAGQVEIERRPLAPQIFADELIQMFEPQAAAKGLVVTCACDPDLPDFVAADGQRLRQILINLVGNAMKFTAEGSVVLALRWLQPDTLRFEVRDTGAGISEEGQARLFQRFSQVDASTSRTHGGTGLGLAICKGLVDAMGGEIGVESAPGRGARFWFEIPAPRTGALSTSAADASQSAEIMAGARVLIVDDNDANRELVTTLLSAFDVEVTEASDGPSAVAAAQALPVDLILMDIRMPGMDGEAAMQVIRQAHGPNTNVPILAFSADVTPENVRALIAAGFDGHVAKPVVPADLLLAIADWTSPHIEGSEPARADG